MCSSTGGGRYAWLVAPNWGRGAAVIEVAAVGSIGAEDDAGDEGDESGVEENEATDEENEGDMDHREDVDPWGPVVLA
jgi:hypothetical protein